MTIAIDLQQVTDYSDLLARIEPRTIASEVQADMYRQVIDTLTDHPMSDGQREMVGLLAQLLAAWEATHEEPVTATPPELVSFLLEENGLAQNALVPTVFPNAPAVSAFLAGKRGITYDRAGKLARFFDVSPAVFYPPSRST